MDPSCKFFLYIQTQVMWSPTPQMQHMFLFVYGLALARCARFHRVGLVQVNWKTSWHKFYQQIICSLTLRVWKVCLCIWGLITKPIKTPCNNQLIRKPVAISNHDFCLRSKAVFWRICTSQWAADSTSPADWISTSCLIWQMSWSLAFWNVYTVD